MENTQQQPVDTQKPQVQGDLTAQERAAAIEHERITGADTPQQAHPETGEKPLTESQLAVVNSKRSGSPTSAATTEESDDLENDAPTPKIGDVVRVHVIENGVAGAKLAYVSGVSSLDEQRLGENGEPYLTVVYLSNPDRRLLGGPDWSKAFTRVGPVHHGSAASAQAGRESVYWTDLLPDATEAIDLPEMALDTEAAGTVTAALAQRESHGQAGRGPVKDSRVPPLGATASEVVDQGRMTRPTPENPASVVAERITHSTSRPAGMETEGDYSSQNATLDMQAESRAHEEPFAGASVGSTTTAAGEVNETGLTDRAPAAPLAGAALQESSTESTAEKVEDEHREQQQG